MDRTFPRFGYLLALLGLSLVALSAVGCAAALFTPLYLLKGTDVDPEYAGLKNHTVVVVCRSLSGLEYQDSRVAKELAHQVAELLKLKVKKIKLVDQRKVDQWTDEHTWDEYPEVGKALDADLVVGIDLGSFRLYQGQTLYQGKANATIRVYDCKAGGDPVFDKSLPQVVYPPNTCVQTSERQESQFRREFLTVLADHIGRCFYPHDAHADYARDAAAM